MRHSFSVNIVQQVSSKVEHLLNWLHMFHQKSSLKVTKIHIFLYSRAVDAASYLFSSLLFLKAFLPRHFPVNMGNPASCAGAEGVYFELIIGGAGIEEPRRERRCH